jgi:hypothetical protein
MAFTVVDTPQDYSSAHGDIICTIYDDNYTYVNYKYVADVYVGDNFITRLKSVPDPTKGGLGVFNFGMIYRNYVNSDFNNYTWDEEIKMTNVLNLYSLEMHIEWGYEYGTSSENNDIGIETTRGITITNHYNSRLLGEQRTLLPYYENNTLSNRPTETSIYNSLQNSSLGFNPKLLVGVWYDYDSELELHVKWTAYNYSNTLTGSVEIDAGAIEGVKFYQLNISPDIARFYSGSLITSSTKYLKIEIIKYQIGGGHATTLLKKYIVNLKCENRYTPITLIWLNKLGTYDSYTFPKVSKKSYNITKKNYNQLEYFIGGDGKAHYYNGDIGNDNKPTYNVNYKESRIINSDLINEETYKWLNELLISPLVYIQSSDFNDRDDFYYLYSKNLIPITITDSTFNFKTKAVERQFNLTLKIEFGDTLNAQYR